MKHPFTSALVLGLLWGATASAAGLSSLADTILYYQEMGIGTPTVERWIYFTSDGRYRDFDSRGRSTAEQDWIYLPSFEGTYTYVQTGPSDYLLSLGSATGAPVPWRTLYYSSDKEGGFSNGQEFSFNFRVFTRSAGDAVANTSSRGRVTVGRPVINGFVETIKSRPILVRAVGPGLAGYGVTDFAANPQLSLFVGSTRVAQNTRWGTPLQGPDTQGCKWVFELCGAFQLTDGSGDSCVFGLAESSIYTAHATAANSADEGEVLVEVYVLPFE